MVAKERSRETKITHGNGDCVVTVYHLQWSAIKCQECCEYLGKKHWRRVETGKPLAWQYGMTVVEED